MNRDSCSICGRPFDEKGTFAHTDAVLRSSDRLLCDECYSAVQYILEYPRVVAAAFEYLT